MARWSTHHLLAEFLARFDDDELRADEIFRLARRDKELRSQIDLAQCRNILTDASLNEIPVAVNVAIHSLLEPAVLQTLMEFKSRATEREVILRLSGLDQIRWEKTIALGVLRQAGFQVALFGSDVGAVTAEKLQNIPADYIVLDPSFAADVDRLTKGMPMVESMVRLCGEHDIRIIFDGVLESDVAKLLARIDGVLCAGPYFGPSVESADQITLPKVGNP